jgi:cholestenol delta-isomerase
METITACVDGPLAFMAVYAFLSQKPYRYVIQLLLSVCQLYGDVLYFMTEIKEDFKHGEMWHPLYFWFYFVFMNILWIIIPSLCIVEACKQLTKVQTLADVKTPASSKKHR